MKDKTLLIMAAGMGSRFGGLKQIEPFGPSGEFIIDYSIYDAKKAGFTKVVFVIKEEIYETFKTTIGKRIEPYIKTEYVFQNNNLVPDEYQKKLEKRKKPLGTAHAILCAKDKIKEPFTVINADDFYGYDAYEKASKYLDNIPKDHYAMVGYKVTNTLSPNGSAKRGVCKLENNKLQQVTECSVERINEKIMAQPEGENKQIEISEETIVSMNLLLFTPDVFDILMDKFKEFLKENQEDLSTVEYQIPSILDYCIKSGKKEIDVITTKATWYGITYKEDTQNVKDAISKLVKTKKYPSNLWENN